MKCEHGHVGFRTRGYSVSAKQINLTRFNANYNLNISEQGYVTCPHTALVKMYARKHDGPYKTVPK